MEGLFLRGYVMARSKRSIQFPDDPIQKEIVTYKIHANGRDVFVTQIEPTNYYPVSEELQEIPVYARPYTDKRGEQRISYRIIDTEIQMKGENF